MPNFYVDVEIDEFVDNLGPREIEELIVYLKDEGYLKNANLKLLSNNDENINDMMWSETCTKLLNNRLQLTDEEQEIVEKITSRFI